MSYRENPKTKGSGIVCCIPQTGKCPNNCTDCFFNSRSYLEPLDENLPNMPTEWDGRVVRINDGNDSNVDRPTVMQLTAGFPMRFYNTAIPQDLEGFREPVVLTVNPGELTNGKAHFLKPPIPLNLMFVRVRTNTWNLRLVNDVVEHYSELEVPVVLTFMAYFNNSIPTLYEKDYVFRKRTLNPYWAITTEAWETVMAKYRYNRWVYSCGKIEGEKGTTACARCGNCVREYFVTKERLRNS